MLSSLSILSLLTISASSLPFLQDSIVTNSTINSPEVIPRAFNIPLNRRSNVGSAMSPSDRLLMLQSNVLKACAKYSLAEIKVPGVGINKRDLGKGIVQMGVAPSDTFYYGTIQVGTPAISFEVSLDTGSSDLILAAPVCTQGCAADTALYRTSYSSTSYTQNIPFLINYQSGGASGFLASDVVSFAGFTVKDQTFGAITKSSTIISTGGVSGLLGLAWRPLASSGALPFVEALWQAGQLPSPLFAFAFARFGAGSQTVNPGGIMTIGGVDPTFYSGPINYISSPSKAYWQIPLQNIVVGSQTISLTAPNVNIDTGTTNIYVPLAVANAIYQQIPGSVVAGSGIYTYPCSSTVTVGFTFGSTTYQISHSDLNIGFSDTGGQNCYGSIAAIGSAPDGSDQYIIGDAFLKNVYSIFRFDPPAIGFAQLANPGLIGQGTVPTGNAKTIAEAGNNNDSPVVGSSSFNAPAPAVAVQAVPAAIVAGANVSPTPPTPAPAPAPIAAAPVAITPPSTPAPVAVAAPAPAVGVSSSGSANVSGLAALLQNAVTAYIADGTRNAILLITCHSPQIIDKSTEVWTCK